MMDRHKAGMQSAYSKYLKSKRARLYAGDSAYPTLMGELLEVFAHDEAAYAGVIAFASAMYRCDTLAATVQGIAVAFGSGMAEDTQQNYEDFLLTKSGLADHPRRDEFLALARQIATEGDRGIRLYRFALWLLTANPEDQR